MREQGLAARRKKRRKAATRPGKGRWRAPDLVKRKFAAEGINRRWYGDGTEIVTGEGKLYLDSVLDMGSRRILGFALGAHHDAALAYGALAMAVAVRGGAVPGVVFHTDQGSEYTAAQLPAGVRAARHRPVDGPAGLGAGQRGDRVVALDAGVRAPVPAQVRHQGGGAGCGRRVDRGLQPRPPALGARHASAPWITSGRWRERTPRDRGGPAARAGQRRRLRRRCPCCAR